MIGIALGIGLIVGFVLGMIAGPSKKDNDTGETENEMMFREVCSKYGHTWRTDVVGEPGNRKIVKGKCISCERDYPYPQ